MAFQENFKTTETNKEDQIAKEISDYENERMELKGSMENNKKSPQKILKERQTTLTQKITTLLQTNLDDNQKLFVEELQTDITNIGEVATYIEDFKQKHGITSRGQIQDNLGWIGFGGEADYDRINNQIRLRDGTIFDPMGSTAFTSIYNSLNNYQTNHIKKLENEISLKKNQRNSLLQKAEKERVTVLREKGAKQANNYVDRTQKRHLNPLEQEITKIETELNQNQNFFKNIVIDIRNIRKISYRATGFPAEDMKTEDAIFLNKFGYIIERDFMNR